MPRSSRLAPSTAGSFPGDRPPGSDPNILLVMLDDVGVEWFDFYGIGQRYTIDPAFAYCRTPQLLALAQNGVVFTEAYANPVCGPSRACVQTGRYALRTGAGENIRSPSANLPVGARLSDALEWLPRVIREARPDTYSTAIVGKWHLCDGYSGVVAETPLPPPDANLDHPNAVGYEYASFHIPNHGGIYAWHRIVNGVLDPPGGFTAPPFDETNWAPSVHARDASTWIASRTTPWFLCLAFNAPHLPLSVPPFSTLSADMVAGLVAAGLAPGTPFPSEPTYAQIQLLWRAAMESVDHLIGQVLSGLSPAVRANTVVIVASDNGTVADALPPGFIHSKREVYRGGTQVPLIVQGPAVVAPGRLSSALTHSVDLYGTILDLAGVEVPAAVADFDSISLLPVIQNGPGKRRRVFAESFRPFGVTDPEQQFSQHRALFDGRWRYVAKGTQRELYDDHADFLEVQDVIASHPEVAAKFERELDEVLGS